MDDGFEWDAAKAASNLEKHGVSFEMAAAVFRDPYALEWLDRASGGHEERYVLLGTVEQRVLVVVYTLRGERLRIITARRALRHERRKYFEERD